LLNHFAWLYASLALPISANKFGKMMHAASQTHSNIVEDQYLGSHFFNEGLDCLNRVVRESVLKVLKKAKEVAWHIDVGGGVLLVRYFCLNASYTRESHFIQGRTLASHSAKALFDGFLGSLTKPTKVLTDDDVLSVKDVCDKTAMFLADGASAMGVRRKGTSATKAFTGDDFSHPLQKKGGRAAGRRGAVCHRVLVRQSSC